MESGDSVGLGNAAQRGFSLITPLTPEAWAQLSRVMTGFHTFEHSPQLFRVCFLLGGVFGCYPHRADAGASEIGMWKPCAQMCRGT